MTFLSRRSPIWTAALACLLVSLLMVPGLAQISAQESTGAVSVVRDEVVADFPQGLTFYLEIGDGPAISKADLLFSVSGNRTLIQSSVQLPDAPGTVIEHFVNMLTLGIPTGVTLSYHWRLQMENGALVDTPIAVADWFDDRYAWTTYATDDIVLYAYGSDGQFYEYAAEVAQNAVSELGARFNAPPRAERLRIWVYESQSDMSGALSPNSREWIGGIAYARYSLIASVVPSGSEFSVLRAIPHEVAHQVIHDATRNPFIYPATWLDEGIAMAVQTVDLEGLDEMVEDAYQAGTLPTVQSMISEFGSDGTSTRLAYAASYSVVTFIEESMGEENVPGLVTAYAGGLSHDDVLMSVLEIDTAELNRLWREYIENQTNA